VLRHRFATGVTLVVCVLASAGRAAAETIAIVTASPYSDEAARYFRTQVDQPAALIETRNARDLEAFVREARRRWHKDLIVVLDAERATVSVVRPSDGTISSRALDLKATSAPYAVALAAVELLEIVRAAPRAHAAALPRPASSRPMVPRAAVAIGLVESVSKNGQIGLLQPTTGIDIELSRDPNSFWVAFGVHATGLSPMRRSQILLLPDGPDENGTIEYARTEVSLRLSMGDRQGAGAAVGYADFGAAAARTTAYDRTVTAVSSDERALFWLGLGGELRYRLGADFSLGIGAGGAFLPVTSTFFASPAGAASPVPAFEESPIEFRAKIALVWESPP
jgi:hypothetical protein